ncbi:MAG: ABC transporter ATP-binding protein [Candidatus Eremiobacteraeota bacterium]|nr:ABC transporter ATP-binding protein [Candidatus Eremiobacteraeota bacterium]
MRVSLFILDIANKYPRQFILTVVLMALLNLAEMGAILSIAPVVDFITRPDLSGASAITLFLVKTLKSLKLPSGLCSVILLMICFAFLRALIYVMVYASVMKIKFALVRDLVCSTYEIFFNARWHFFASRKQGMLGNTIIKECFKVGDYFAHMAMVIVKIVQVLFYFIVALFLSWKLSLAVMVPGILLAIPFSYLGKITYRLGQTYIEMSNRTFEIIQENLAAAKIVIGFGGQRRGVENLEKAIHGYVAAEMKSQIMHAGTPIVFQPLAIGIILVAVALSQSVFRIVLSDLTVILYAFYLAIPQFGQIIGIKNVILNIIPSYDQINALRDAALKERQSTGKEAFTSFNDSIVLREVGFSYPGGMKVLDGINVTIPRGKMIAFVGKSGAGKSTLIDMLMRFYDADTGEILVDGRNILDFAVLSLRKRIGYVPQESILFNMTLRENLQWSSEAVNDADVEYACRMANVDEFLNGLPQGLDTVVGDRGVCISGGQRQRIALARAIIRRPELLILDEATSSLDSISEKLIQEAIEKIAHETTVVVVAHRLSTVVNADYIYVLDEGKIVEEGTFEDLCVGTGVFHELAKVQGMVE